MMGTERRSSLVGIAASPTSSVSSASAAIPRDFQPAMPSSVAATVGSLDSPSRKRRRSDLLLDAPEGSRNGASSSTLTPGDRAGGATLGGPPRGASGEDHNKRQKSRSPHPGNYHGDARPQPWSRPEPRGHHWSDRGPIPSSYGDHDSMSRTAGPSRQGVTGMEPPSGRSESSEPGWRDARRIAGLVSGRSIEGERPSPGYGGHERPQSEVSDTMRSSRRGLLLGPLASATSAAGGDHYLPNVHVRAPSSPPPRLPSFASLENEGIGSRAREEGYAGLSPGLGAFASSGHTSPRRVHPYRPAIQHPYFSGPAGRTPILAHPSPSASSTYGNPPMIHPSLAGLPGAGGGQGGKQQPSFVSKLYSMLEDPSIGEMISWGHSGTVFSVANPAEFSRLVLPNWFKHSNWQSFVRQLNMYGFHKVNHSYQGNPTDEIQVWEFRHPNFRRGEIGLLNDIKRKSSRQKRVGSPSRSLAGTDLRADRSGGSSTPSPEVALAAIPGGSDPMRPQGLYRPGREHAMSDPRIDVRAYDLAASDPRSFRMEDASYLSMGGSRMRRPKTELPMSGTGAGGGAGLGASNAYSAAGASLFEERLYPETQLDRNEVVARFDDLSERTDAIIRHASFLESQVRTLSQQLNESRAYTQQAVRDELATVLDRLVRSLTAPAQPGADPTQAMVSVIKSHLALLQPRERDRERDRDAMPNDSARSVRPSAAVAARSPSPSGAYLTKHPSV